VLNWPFALYCKCWCCFYVQYMISIQMYCFLKSFTCIGKSRDLTRLQCSVYSLIFLVAFLNTVYAKIVERVSGVCSKTHYSVCSKIIYVLNVSILCNLQNVLCESMLNVSLCFQASAWGIFTLLGFKFRFGLGFVHHNHNQNHEKLIPQHRLENERRREVYFSIVKYILLISVLESILC
jgi:hypothetical protein